MLLIGPALGKGFCSRGPGQGGLDRRLSLGKEAWIRAFGTRKVWVGASSVEGFLWARGLGYRGLGAGGGLDREFLR